MSSGEKLWDSLGLFPTHHISKPKAPCAEGRGPGPANLARVFPGEWQGMAATPYDPFSFPGEIRASENSYFCQAARQLASVPSSQLCVKLASGGDPTYAFNIRFTGEEVHGTSK